MPCQKGDITLCWLLSLLLLGKIYIKLLIYLVFQRTATSKNVFIASILTQDVRSYVVDTEYGVGGKNKVTRVIWFSFGTLQLWHVTSHDRLTVKIKKIPILSLKIFLDKTQENVKDFLSTNCQRNFLTNGQRNKHRTTFCESMEQSVQQNALQKRLAAFVLFVVSPGTVKTQAKVKQFVNVC